SHSVTKDAFQCAQCHTSKDKGIMPFEALGYPPERVKDLRNLEELKMLPPGASGAAPRAAPATATVKH
ncbi:MAG: hypothetical protein KGJ70_07095, partial [Gemmatimonadota bacterium]|nr:hypothetical protein [Gemmatimonadota bacterium]